MFIVAQFPIADMRSFIPEETHRVPAPDWFAPQIGKDFVRHCGQMSPRARGGLSEWVGEELFCDASKAVLFKPSLRSQSIGPFSGKRNLVCAFRRLFSDGGAVTRLEIGFHPTRELTQPLDLAEWVDTLRGLLSLKVCMSGKPSDFEFRSTGSHFAAHYLDATTRRDNGTVFQPPKWWVQSGMAVLLIESLDSELPRLQLGSKCLLRRSVYGNSFEVWWGWLKWAGDLLPIWNIRIPKPYDYDVHEVRRVRLYILRLHAERECLKQLLRLLARNEVHVIRGSLQSERLQTYLRRSSQVLNRAKIFGLKRAELLGKIQDLEDMVSEGSRDRLIQNLSALRLNIFRSVKKLTEPAGARSQRVQVFGPYYEIQGTVENLGGTTVTKFNVSFGANSTVTIGNLALAKSIQNSFNSVDKAAVSGEKKRALQELHKGVASIADHLSPEESEEVATSLDMLTKQTLSATPSKRWYEVSAQGLIEAAKAVGQLGGPIISAVNTILSLLRGTAGPA